MKLFDFFLINIDYIVVKFNDKKNEITIYIINIFGNIEYEEKKLTN